MISHTNTVPLENFTIQLNIDVLQYTSSINLFIAMKIANILLYKMIIFLIRFGDDKGGPHNYRIN